MEHLKCAIQKRFITFSVKLETSPKMVVRNINRMIGKDCRSTTGENIRRIILSCGSDPFTGPTREDISKKGFEEVPAGEEWRAGIINELIDIREGLLEPNGWTSEEVDETLTHLCIT